MAWTTVFGPDLFNGTAFTALPTYDASYAQNASNGEWRIGTNTISAGCTATSAPRCYLASAPAADQAVEYVIVGSGANLQREEGHVVRFTDGDAGNFWGGTGYVQFIESDGKLYMYRLDGGGSHTQLQSPSYTPANGDVVRMEAIEGTVSSVVNTTNLGTTVDATYATGTVGMWSGLSLDSAVNMSIDNFTVQVLESVGYLLVKN